MADGPFALKDDGSAKDPKAFQQALRSDEAKMAALKEEPETLKVVMGDDMHALQELIKSVYQVARTNTCHPFRQKDTAFHKYCMTSRIFSVKLH